MKKINMNAQGVLFGEMEEIVESVSLNEKFELWLMTPNGQKVWDLFFKTAVLCKRKGKKYGAKAIIEHLRYRPDIPVGPDGYRVNNTWAPYLARKAMAEIAELRGYFEVRELSSK